MAENEIPSKGLTDDELSQIMPGQAGIEAAKAAKAAAGAGEIPSKGLTDDELSQIMPGQAGIEAAKRAQAQNGPNSDNPVAPQ